MLFLAAARVSVSALCVLIMSIRGHVTRDTWRGLIGHSVISTNNQHGHQTTSHIPTWCYQFKTSLDLNLIIYLLIWRKLCFLCLPEGNPCSLHQYCQFTMIRSLEVENAYWQEFVQMWTYEWAELCLLRVKLFRWLQYVIQLPLVNVGARTLELQTKVREDFTIK